MTGSIFAPALLAVENRTVPESKPGIFNFHTREDKHDRSYSLAGQYKTRTTDYGLRTTDYGLGIKHGLRYKTQTKHYKLGIKYELGIKHGLGYEQAHWV